MRRTSGLFLTASCALAALGWPVAAAAQSDGSVSRPVVQPLPPPGVDDLNDALQRLARNAVDLGALIDAGNASLQLNDIDAAIGFFGRAQELSPSNARVKLGLAGAFVRSERPIDALRLFDEAERAGAATAAVAGDRGLAYDMVGDNAAAQEQYRLALAAGENDDIVRRYAISQAISGDRAAFEKTLYPQLEREDFAGFRARAFGLAILGDEEEAVAIADAVMPRDLAARIAPYLRYMGRLTKAQQAAAANLGVFPRAAQIGRDDPRIAQYSASSSAARDVGARLAPSGEALGRRVEDDSQAQRRRPGVGTVGSTGRTPDAAPAQASRPGVIAGPAPSRGSSQPGVIEGPPLSGQASRPGVIDSPPPRAATVSEPVVQPIPASAQVVAQGPAAIELPPSTAAAPDPQPARIVLTEPSSAEPGFDLGAVGTDAAQGAATPEPAPPPIDQASVADAFAGFTLPRATTSAAAAGAVDITTITPRREVEAKPAAKPAPPAHPRRFWVQVATGKDLAAFRWDWRRISREAPEVLGDFKPMTTPWGEANRLLAGPFKTEKAASDAVGKLRDAGLDSFPFTSAEGEEISPLG